MRHEKVISFTFLFFHHALSTSSQIWPSYQTNWSSKPNPDSWINRKPDGQIFDHTAENEQQIFDHMAEKLNSIISTFGHKVKFGPMVFYLIGPSIIYSAIQLSIYLVLRVRSNRPARKTKINKKGWKWQNKHYNLQCSYKQKIL